MCCVRSLIARDEAVTIPRNKFFLHEVNLLIIITMRLFVYSLASNVIHNSKYASTVDI